MKPTIPISGHYGLLLTGTGTFPEIAVRGNATDIPDGDLSPSLADHSDFGGVPTASGSVVRTFTVENTGAYDLNLTGSPKVSVSGTHAGDFLVTSQPVSPVAPGASTTFQITFNPSADSLHSATLSIANDDPDENPFDFAIVGYGLGTALDTDSDGMNDLGDYPEFKGYHADTRWVVLHTDEGDLTFVAEDESLFFRNFSADYAKEGNRGVNPAFPKGDLSFLDGIAPQRNKISAVDAPLMGPQGEPNRATGDYRRTLYFRF